MEATQYRDEDERQLAEMGLRQDLNRGWSAFSNFAISFTIISVLAGCFTTYGQAWNNGGPIAISWGWPLISIPILIIGFCMSEIVAKYPTAGGIYWWAARLGGPVWGWFTGWFNLVGLVGVVASVVYASATFLNVVLGLYGVEIGGINFGDDEHILGETFLLFAIILAIHATINIMRTHLLAVTNNISVFVHVVGVVVIIAHPHLRPRRPSERRLRLHRADQQLRLQHGHVLVLRAAARLLADAVHDHRLRRLGPRLRGNPQRIQVGSTRGLAVDLLLGGDRLVRAPGDHVRRDRPGRGHGRRGLRRRELARDLQPLADHRGVQGGGLDLDDRPALLRPGLPHERLEDVLRLRPRPWPAGLGQPLEGEPQRHAAQRGDHDGGRRPDHHAAGAEGQLGRRSRSRSRSSRSSRSP